eukprot:TRINITY_DN66221_c0_g1_i1.p1 TRINITY_DN66221_c0_g1~~TRINITY_DN66221_c0_g1_i1.p1  ORF type:complete len:203 (+),score=51.38 TRINITY_DN66221_c0_g1_i1:68-676(+)
MCIRDRYQRRVHGNIIMEKMRGLFIVFEGLDRSGKSTQAAKLEKALEDKGKKVKLMVFPNRETEIGKLISSYLKSSLPYPNECIHLLFAANRWEMKDEIIKLLNEGVTVILDRYAFSGIVYTAAKGLEIEWCKAPDRGLPKPDMVAYIDISIEDIQKRAGFGEEKYESAVFQKKVHEKYEACLLYTSPSPRDLSTSRMPSSA